jgi:hypothetical protein
MIISGSKQVKLFWSYESGVEFINKKENIPEKKVKGKPNKKLLAP